MKAIIYARYSCDNQREESIEGQLRECKAFAEHKEFTLVGTYIDRAVSAKTDNRPEFQKMIKDSAKGMFDVIIVWKLDRFARNRYDSAHYKAILRKNGVKVISATEVISEGAEGIILESVLEGYAEYYSAELSEKVIRGMTENALKCQYNGGFIPVGYTIDNEKHYQVDPLTAPFVREAFLMYANGKQVKEIVEYLNDHGILSSQRKPMTKTTVSTILQNRKYIGEYQYRDVVIPDGIPAVISKELFEMAQARLEKNRYAPSVTKADEKYLLSTKLMCGDCGAFMVGESGKSGTNGKKYYYYKCSSSKKKSGCHRKALRKAETEELVINSTIKNIFNDNVIEDIAKGVTEWQERENTAIPLLKKELAEIEKSLGNVMAAIEQGIITATTKKRMNELEVQKTEIEVRLVKEEIQSQVLTKEQVIYWLSKMREMDLNNEDSRERIIDTFVNSIYVYDDRMVINFNCREDSEMIPLGLAGESSDLCMVGELTVHYLSMPVIVTLISAAAGNILGYTVFKNVVVSMYYNSYSLPRYYTVWNSEAFVKTTVIPIGIMLAVNLLIIVKTMGHTPLQFLRHDLKKSKRKKAVRLPKWSFLSRFRLRVMLQNIPNYLILFSGIIFISVMLSMAVGMPSSLAYYKANAKDNMIANYQYILKSYEDENGNIIETENRGAEKFLMTSLVHKGDELNEEISIYGIAENSEYVEIPKLENLNGNEVYISNSFAEKYRLKKGDSFPLEAKYENIDYEFTVAGIYDRSFSAAAFMPIENYRKIFETEDGEFSGFMSDEELSDLDGDSVAMVITERDITKMCDQLEHSMGSYMQYFQVLCILLSAVLIYLLTKIIIEKNQTAISMTKILGYENREISSLYLTSTTVIMFIADGLSVFIGTLIMSLAWRSIMMGYSGWIDFVYRAPDYIKIFAFIMLGYLIVMFFDFRRIKKIPMDEALKNVE